jgi:hypothetical protein
MYSRVFLCALTLTGCGTITRGTTEQLQILSDPPGAEARTSLGHQCETPCTITISRKDEFNVSIEKEGFQRAQVPVITTIGGAGGAAFAGNILLGGVVGMGADAATGAAYDHTPNPVFVTLRPLAAPPAPPQKSIGKRGKPTS